MSDTTNHDLTEIQIEACWKCRGTGRFIYSYRNGFAAIVSCDNCDGQGVVCK